MVEKEALELCDFCCDLGIKRHGNYVFRIKYKTIDMVHERGTRLCWYCWSHALSMTVRFGWQKEHQFEGVEMIARTDPIKEEGRPGKYRVGGDS